ncbi:hypothetical protein DPEC_G00109020 [Dallia pectoralis]|uniref:Uncharacterized protein n=1 Tax=Dallia pectoralis TaxID=75939 RepID=A0ACC2GSI5_DALPE|nr:hypothetical protein DPEC_G00109020 [Dallia pectoralis]
MAARVGAVGGQSGILGDESWRHDTGLKRSVCGPFQRTGWGVWKSATRQRDMPTRPGVGTRAAPVLLAWDGPRRGELDGSMLGDAQFGNGALECGHPMQLNVTKLPMGNSSFGLSILRTGHWRGIHILVMTDLFSRAARTLEGWVRGAHHRTLTEAYAKVGAQSRRRQGWDQARYNKKARAVPLLAGEKRVLLRNFRRGRSLCPHWVPSPFVVVAQRSLAERQWFSDVSGKTSFDRDRSSPLKEGPGRTLAITTTDYDQSEGKPMDGRT